MYKRFNNWFGNILVNALSSMEAFYIITALVLFPLVIQKPETLILWVMYMSTTIFQASSLPVISYTAKKSGEKTEKKIDEIYNAIMIELNYMKEIQQSESEERAKLQQIIAEIHEHYTK